MHHEEFKPRPETDQPLDRQRAATPSAANADRQGRGRGGRRQAAADPGRAQNVLRKIPQNEIARGVAALCDAIGHLRRVTNATQGSAMNAGMERVMTHLTQAAACLPDEMFAVMLIAHSVGFDEVRRRLQGTAEEGIEG